MQTLAFPSQKTETITTQAIFVAESIDCRAIENHYECIASLPSVIKVSETGMAVLFHYGVVVLFGLSQEEEEAFLKQLSAYVSEAFTNPETEKVEIKLNPEKSERVKNGVLWLKQYSVEHLQIVADVLAKTVVLAHYETKLASVFDQVEPFTASLQKNQRLNRPGEELLHELGSTFLFQYKMVARVEIIDKPELLWEFPELENLYLRLEDEYEIRERHMALERKLDLIYRTSQSVLELMQHRTSLRAEWYIVILIIIEIVLSLYELFIKG
ncbi:MAG: RMD1 family protein [Halothece sp.]